jgi:hypothetical protein
MPKRRVPSASQKIDEKGVYRLVRLTMGQHDPVPITVEEYKALAVAKCGFRKF